MVTGRPRDACLADAGSAPGQRRSGPQPLLHKRASVTGASRPPQPCTAMPKPQARTQQLRGQLRGSQPPLFRIAVPRTHWGISRALPPRPQNTGGCGEGRGLGPQKRLLSPLR